jgi:hypothetical protein
MSLWSKKSDVPQGLKPSTYPALTGTAEVVPFHKPFYELKR